MENQTEKIQTMIIIGQQHSKLTPEQVQKDIKELQTLEHDCRDLEIPMPIDKQILLLWYRTAEQLKTVLET